MKNTKYHFDHYQDTTIDFELIKQLTAASVPDRMKYRLKELDTSEETLEKVYGCKIDCFSIGTKITILSGDWCHIFTFFMIQMI